MLLIILSFHVLLVWHSQEVSAGEITVNPSGCGRVPTNHSTVNGLLPDDDRLPWMVILAVEYTRYSVTCTGSILTRLHVLTVSHCTYMNGNVPISIQASYGSPIQYQGYMVSVEKVLRHPGFVQQTYANDISLLKVDKPFVLSELVNPICVSLSPVDVLRKRVRVAGWGHLEHRGPPQLYLRYTNVTALPNQKCVEVFGKFGYNSTIMFCAHETIQNTCEGDSGGPAVVRADDGRFLVVGLVSYGIGCTNRSIPGVYTRLDAFVTWLTENVASDDKFIKLYP